MKKHILFLLIFSPFLLFAQRSMQYTTKSGKAIKHYERATENFDRRINAEAEKEAKEALLIDSNFVEAQMLLGDIAVDMRKLEPAIMAYTKAIEINPDFFPNTFFTLGKLEMKAAKFTKALAHLEKFVSYPRVSAENKKQCTALIEKCRFAEQAMRNPVPFQPTNLGDSINTADGEYSPAITADEQTLYFTKESKRQEDIFFSEKQDQQWSKAIPIGSNINTEDNEGAISIASDGQTMYFAAASGFEKANLYMVRKTGNRWSKPMKLDAPVNSEYKESQPSISSDGKVLYFISDRPGGYGKLDIWKTYRNTDGIWSIPVNMGPEINTAESDQSPCIHPDNHTFYFTSEGHLGMGGYDYFMSKLDDNGKPGKAFNLGYPINSPLDERGLVVNAAGTKAYYASENVGGKGRMDLYSFDLYAQARPTSVSYMKGKVFDKSSKIPLDARFELIDLETKKTVTESFSDVANGEFLVCLAVGKNYALNVSKKGYLFYSENFSLKDIKSAIDPVLMDVPIQAVKTGEHVVLKNIFFETNSYELKNESNVELEKLTEFLNKNLLLKIEISGHTDNTGEKSHNLELSEKRAQSVYNYLIQAGIPANRLSFKGYGDSMPVYPNDSDVHKAANRRTEFSIIAFQ